VASVVLEEAEALAVVVDPAAAADLVVSGRQRHELTNFSGQADFRAPKA
jgi:hypothetical protein